MKIKLIASMFEKTLENRANEFLANKGIKVLEIKYKPTIFYYSVMIVYDEVN